MANKFSRGGNNLFGAESGKSGSSLFEYYGFTKKDERKYPVISRILKQLTPERIRKEIEVIQRVKLPPELQKWVKEYEKVGERNEFLWKWIYKISEVTHLSCISKKYAKSLRNIKFFISMLIILLDDVADKIKNKKLLNGFSKILFKQTYIIYNQLNLKEKNYIELAIKLWGDIIERIKKYPRFNEFENTFKDELVQIFNGMKFAYLVHKKPHLINKRNYWLYFPHSMQVIMYSTFDLMCSPKFDFQELKQLKEILLQAQKMARIGNWTITWEKEIKENDYTSGVFAYGMDEKIITPNDLKKENKLEIIKRIKSSNIENELLKEWEESCYEIKLLNEKIKSVNIKRLLSALEKLLILELSSKYYK